MMRVLASPAFINRFVNPYNWLLYTHMVRLGARVNEFSPVRLLPAGRYAIWHLHWPDALLNQGSYGLAAAGLKVLLRLIDMARARGIRVVWTVHNLRAHEGLHPKLERWFWRAFTRRLDGYISLTETSRAAALERFPGLRALPGSVIPHGHYRGMYPDSLTRDQARARLAIPQPARVYAFLGHIRGYKNVPALIEAFRQLEDEQAVLVIAGRPSSAPLRDRIERAAAGDRRIRLHLGYVPTAKVQLYLRAADVVVLPYGEILNSGSALLALSFDRPVLVPAKGSLVELERQIGGDWIRTYDGDISSAELAAGMRWALTTPRADIAPLNSLEWSALARRTLEAYERFCEEAPARGSPDARMEAGALVG